MASFGRQFMTWMEDATAPGCTVPRITLTLEDIPQPPWVIDYTRRRLGFDENEIVADVNPMLIENDNVPREQSMFRKVNVWNSATSTTWMGWVGPSVMLIEAIGRVQNSGDPRITDLTKAIYARTYDINGLCTIFFCDVINQETTRIFQNHIEPHLPRNQHIFTFQLNRASDIDNFHLLLGTEIGRVAARFILGVWGQGERRVDQITISLLSGMPRLILYMRFDIGPNPRLLAF